MIRVKKIERVDSDFLRRLREALAESPIIDVDVEGEYERRIWKGWQFYSLLKKDKNVKAVRFGKDYAYIVDPNGVRLYSYVPFGGFEPKR